MLISFSFIGDSLAIHAMLEERNWSFSFFLVARSYLKTWGCLNLSSVNILHHSLVSPAMYIVVMESYYFFKVLAALKILLHILKEILKILCIVYTLEFFNLGILTFIGASDSSSMLCTTTFLSTSSSFSTNYILAWNPSMTVMKLVLHSTRISFANLSCSFSRFF